MTWYRSYSILDIILVVCHSTACLALSRSSVWKCGDLGSVMGFSPGLIMTGAYWWIGWALWTSFFRCSASSLLSSAALSARRWRFSVILSYSSLARLASYFALCSLRMSECSAKLSTVRRGLRGIWGMNGSLWSTTAGVALNSASSFALLASSSSYMCTWDNVTYSH